MCHVSSASWSRVIAIFIMLQVQDHQSPQLMVAYPVSEHLMYKHLDNLASRPRPKNPFNCIISGTSSPVIAWQGDMHWRSMAVCSSSQTVWLHDPLGGYSDDMWRHVISSFKRLGNAWQIREMACKPLQADVYNCGIWAAFFAGIWAQWLAQVTNLCMRLVRPFGCIVEGIFYPTCNM
jgi:hypothetical protein